MRTFFGVIIAVYVEDVFVSGPSETIDSEFNAIKSACRIFGISVRTFGWASTRFRIITIVGDIANDKDGITARLPGRKKQELPNELHQVRERKSPTPAPAAKLRGALGFSKSLLFGRIGRALLDPPTTRQYTKNLGRRIPLNEEIEEIIPRWANMLSADFPTRTLLTRRCHF